MLLAVTILCAPPVFARSLGIESSAVKATFSDTGEYRVRCNASGWILAGKLSDKPFAVTHGSGADSLGAWQEVAARTRGEIAAIRVYESTPVVLFRARTAQLVVHEEP
jgi:hypothetical protein